MHNQTAHELHIPPKFLHGPPSDNELSNLISGVHLQELRHTNTHYTIHHKTSHLLHIGDIKCIVWLEVSQYIYHTTYGLI